MRSTFWTNTIWYVLLGITSVIAIIVILHKSRNRKFTIAFMFAILALTYSGETLLLGLFGGAYSYFPKILKEAFLDTVNGNYFSQVSVSTTLVLLAVYELPTIWNYIFAAVYCLIEVSFIKLGIYQQHWYRTWYTFIGFILLAFLVKKWHHKMLNAPKFWIYYITLYLATLSSYGHTRAIFVYSGIRVIHYNVYQDLFKDQVIFIHIPAFIIINIMIALNRLKLNRVTKSMVFICLFVIQYILNETGMMYIQPGWFFIVTAVDLFGCYFWVVVMDYLLSTGAGTIRQ